MLNLGVVSLIGVVNRLLEGLNSSGISFDFPIQDSFEDPTGISPLHRRIPGVFDRAHLCDLVGELFDGSIVLILHTLIMAPLDGTLKPKIINASVDHLNGFLLRHILPPNIINADDIRQVHKTHSKLLMTTEVESLAKL
jgi:hypothetical protein